MVLDFIILRKGMGMADNVIQPQTVQVPNYSGVNIQIFNPTVAAPGSNVPASNVNAQNYSTAPVYPANYYTQNLAQQPQAQPVQPVQPVAETGKKKESKNIVVLTDDYIKTLEGYLNSQDNRTRLVGAKEVFARFKEDESRQDDPALNALLNKMLKDPYQPVRFMAMSTIENRYASGNTSTAPLLQKIQQTPTMDHSDEMMATNALLRMSEVRTKKEFEVNETSKHKGEKH